LIIEERSGSQAQHSSSETCYPNIAKQEACLKEAHTALFCRKARECLCDRLGSLFFLRSACSKTFLLICCSILRLVLGKL
jgi:hypothetical protein